VTGALQQFLREMRDRCDWCKSRWDITHEFSLTCPLMGEVNRSRLEVIRIGINSQRPLARFMDEQRQKEALPPSRYEQREGYRVRVRP